MPSTVTRCCIVVGEAIWNLLVSFFRGELLEDLPSKLRLVAESGFGAVEAGPLLFDWGSSAALSSLLEAEGLHVSAVHGMTGTITDIGRFCEQMLSLGCRQLIYSGIVDSRTDFEGYRATGRFLSEQAACLQQYGIRVSYHHHDWELTQSFDGEYGLALLLRDLHPNIGLVVDTYWAKIAGVSLAWLWARYGARCWNVHLKDGLLDRVFRPLGAGEMSIDTACSFIADKPLQYLTWEQDNAGDREVADCVRERGRWLCERLAE